MRAGPLDRSAVLKHQVLTKNTTTGEDEVSYSIYATVWAGKRDLRGREFFAAQQVNSDITTIWQIRYRTDVVPSDQIVVDDVSYNISSIAEIGRREGLEIQATAVL
jgi:SPP1 family predicted phage head-tail adaptor